MKNVEYQKKIDVPIWKLNYKYNIPRLSYNNKQKVLLRDDYTCKICGRHKSKLAYFERLEVDHIIPRAEGGNTSFNNSQTLCSSCHFEKTKEEILLRRVIWEKEVDEDAYRDSLVRRTFF